MTSSMTQIEDALRITMRLSGMDGKPRQRSADTIRDANIDPQTMEAIATLLVETATPEQLQVLHTTPIMAIMLGVCATAAYINDKRDKQSDAEAVDGISFDAALGESRN